MILSFVNVTQMTLHFSHPSWVSNHRKERELSNSRNSRLSSGSLDLTHPIKYSFIHLQSQIIDRSSVHLFAIILQLVQRRRFYKKRNKQAKSGRNVGYSLYVEIRAVVGWKTRNRLLWMTVGYLHVPSRPLYSPGTSGGTANDGTRGVSWGLEAESRGQASQFRTSNTRKQANASLHILVDRRRSRTTHASV